MDNNTGIAFFSAKNKLCESGFARTVGTYQRNLLVGVDPLVKAGKNDICSERFMNIF